MAPCPRCGDRMCRADFWADVAMRRTLQERTKDAADAARIAASLRALCDARVLRASPAT